MSTGPGRVQRAILAAFAAEPDAAFSIEELCIRVYGLRRLERHERPKWQQRHPWTYSAAEKRHRVAVLRAVRGLPNIGIRRRSSRQNS